MLSLELYNTTESYNPQSNPKEVSSVLSALSKVATAFPSFERPEDVGFKSALLNDIVFSLPRIHDPVQAFLGDLDLKQAKEGNLTELWKNPDKYPEVEDARFVGDAVTDSQ